MSYNYVKPVDDVSLSNKGTTIWFSSKVGYFHFWKIYPGLFKTQQNTKQKFRKLLKTILHTVMPCQLNKWAVLATDKTEYSIREKDLMQSPPKRISNGRPLLQCVNIYIYTYSDSRIIYSARVFVFLFVLLS